MVDLKTARKRARLTQKQVAEALGVTQATICTIEKKKHFPRPELARRIERLFGQVLDLYPEDIRGVYER